MENVELKDGNVNCVESNSPVSADSVEEQIVIQPDVIVNEKPKKTKKIIFISVISLLIVAIITCGCFYAVNRHKEKTVALSFNESIVNLPNTEYTLKTLEDMETTYNGFNEFQKKYVTNYDSFVDTKYEFLLKTLAQAINNSYESSEAACSIVIRAWYNSIYKNYDEYNKGDYSDFNNAIAAAMESSEYKVHTAAISMYNDTIDVNLSKLKNGPDKYQKEYDALLELYAAYVTMSELAISPDGSYNSVSEEYTEYKNTYSLKAAALKALDPTII